MAGTQVCQCHWHAGPRLCPPKTTVHSHSLSVGKLSCLLLLFFIPFWSHLSIRLFVVLHLFFFFFFFRCHCCCWPCQLLTLQRLGQKLEGRRTVLYVSLETLGSRSRFTPSVKAEEVKKFLHPYMFGT